jgi:predicted transcriptional regulator
MCVQKVTKNNQKRKNARISMCANELKQIRYMMRFDPRDMCATLGLKRRTYQDYEAGKRKIPQDVAARIRETYRLDCQHMNTIDQRVDAAVKKKYPNGIPSEVD